MLKQKFLHRKSRNKRHHKKWDEKYHRIKNLDIFSDNVPQHEPIRRKYRWCNIDTDPLKEFIESKIGCDWDDVYSEILSKIDPKFRREIDNSIDYYIIKNAYYNEEFIPYGQRKYGKFRILYDEIFLDNNNILTKKSLEEIMLDSKRFLRLEKLKKIKEEQEKDQNNQELSS